MTLENDKIYGKRTLIPIEIVNQKSISYLKEELNSYQLVSLSKKFLNCGNVFAVWLTNERRLALIPAGTIVRDPQHHLSPTLREEDLNLHGTWVRALMNEILQ